MLDGVARAGFDFLSLGNNHIGDAGRDGVLETIAELEARDIRHSGAGQTPDGARAPAILETHGVRIAVLGCDAVAAVYWVEDRPDSVGSASCETDEVEQSIGAIRDEVDVVIVYPHWGVEYRATPTDVQREQAAAWVAAGADVIIGNHAHWAAAAELVDNRLVFYALGNFVFDQTWSVNTMEGLVLELTFEGRRVRQAWLHPTLLIDQSQPNFLDPAAEDGKAVIDQVREASRGLLPY
jgi:poly-gamma-glutamate synthesis protein (capsule biosynthesis protein)